MNDDLISREELKKHKFLTPQYIQLGGRHNGRTIENIYRAYQKGWNDAIDAIIDNAPTVERPTGEWIPCSGNIPEEEGYYLTTTIHNQVYCDYWNGVNFDRTEMVVAWMPLPEPYKKEEEEE